MQTPVPPLPPKNPLTPPSYQNLNSLRDQRTALQAAQQEKWTALKELQDEYYQARNAYRQYEREARKIREERRAKEQAEYKLAKKRAEAAEKLEAASQPAFASQIITCEGLIAFFDPSSAEAARKEKLAAAPRELAAKPTREVKPLGGKVLVKEEEDYFVGTGGKKKKGKKPRTTPTEDETPAAPAKFNLNVGLLEQLAQIDVIAPSSQSVLPQVLEKLREKLQYYKDNQDRVTKEVCSPLPPGTGS
jgi:predicted RNase H-like nuclease (RuvC/YqgF family)